jgi:hypothetical protein
LLTILAENQILGTPSGLPGRAFAQLAGNPAVKVERQFLLQCKIVWNDSNRCSVEQQCRRLPARSRKPRIKRAGSAKKSPAAWRTMDGAFFDMRRM